MKTEVCNTTGKIKHETEGDALSAAVRSAAKYNTSQLSVYLCLYCNYWHLTKRVKKHGK